MHVSLVMTVIGQDRPGLVDSVATIVAEQGGNWLESRMSHLGGQFAGILRVRLPSENEAALMSALKELEAEGLTTVVRADDHPGEQSARTLRFLEIVGQDRPGIVRQISHALASHGVNVEELNSECQSAPMTGEMLFKARAKLYIGETCDVAKLRADLERIAADLIVDISLEELVPADH